MLRTVRLASVGARRFSASAKRTSLNADLAEGFGPWTMTADAELMEMIERADTDQDGEISPDEFYGIMTKKTFT